VGALRPGLLGSAHPLPRARVLYELGQRGRCTASDLVRELDLDPGYLSRLLRPLKGAGLVQARRSAADARARLLCLTAKGNKAFRALDARARKEVSAMLGALGEAERSRLVGAMQALESILEGRAGEITLRAHRPGDMGWVVQAHGEIYAREYGWDERFEALVAGIVARFIARLDPARERCWIAEADGERVGSVFLVRGSKSAAKLRLLLVHPRARGRGLGRRLVEECVAFARASGYRRLELWTQSNLAAARAVYRACGFSLQRTEKHASFGTKLTGEYWELAL
jgi:DNA-binding MarR family transcriptional regulator/N-acetylglutamate synthase-like GNAT family acetyltransferase